MSLRRFTHWLLLPLIALLFSCGDDKEENLVADRTVIFYISAQNDLYGLQTLDWQEIIAGAKLLGNNQKIVAYVDAVGNPSIYVLTNKTGSNPQPTYTFGSSMNSSDPQTLLAVLNWTKANAPAKDYGITFWSHSDGWLPPPTAAATTVSSVKGGLRQPLSFGIDSGTPGSNYTASGKQGTSMRIADLANAIAQSGLYFKYIFFDSCLMQNLEVIYDLRNVTDYVIGAPMFIPAVGAYYPHVIPQGLFSSDPVNIARTYYADTQDESLPSSTQNNYQAVGLVVSAVKTEGIEELAALTRTLLAPTNFISGEADLTGVQYYLSYVSAQGYRPEYYDAGLVMKKLLSATDYEQWRSLYDKCVVYKAGTPKFYSYKYSSATKDTDLSADFTGVTMFVPQKKYTTYAGVCAFGNLNTAFLSTAWAKAIGF